MGEKNQEQSSFDKVPANPVNEKLPEQSIERLRAIAPKILDITDSLTQDGSHHERIVWLLLRAAVEAAHAGSDQSKQYRSEAEHAAHLNVQQALDEFRNI